MFSPINASPFLHLQRVEKSLILIAHGIDVDAQDCLGQTVLHLAITSQCVSLVQVLLKNKARMDICDNNGVNALQLAKQLNNPDILRWVTS